MKKTLAALAAIALFATPAHAATYPATMGELHLPVAKGEQRGSHAVQKGE